MSRSRGGMIRPKDAAEPLAAFDLPGRCGRGVAVDQAVAQPLVVALQVIMGRVFVDGVPEVPLADGDDLGEAFFFDGPHESLGVRIEVRTAGWEYDRLDAGGA